MSLILISRHLELIDILTKYAKRKMSKDRREWINRQIKLQHEMVDHMLKLWEI